MKEAIENVLNAAEKMKNDPVVTEKEHASELATYLRKGFKGPHIFLTGIIFLWLVTLINSSEGIVLGVAYVGVFGQIFAYANLYFGYTFIELPIRKNWNDMRPALYFIPLTYTLPFVIGALNLILN